MIAILALLIALRSFSDEIFHLYVVAPNEIFFDVAKYQVVFIYIVHIVLIHFPKPLYHPIVPSPRFPYIDSKPFGK